MAFSTLLGANTPDVTLRRDCRGHISYCSIQRNTLTTPWGGGIKSLHDKPNGCARAAMIGAITQKLRRNYADYAQITQKLRRLRRNYAYITQKLRMLRRNYAEITQKLRRNYAEITQKLRKKNYAKITRVCVICVISKITHTPFC